MVKKIIFTTIFTVVILFSALHAYAQTRQTRGEYVNKYKEIAIKHMEEYGIPASITMAQGVLESDAGNSNLSKKSNNHFGIKCKTGWKGRSVKHDDDAPGECFRAYDTVEESYRDHADFLDTGERYDSLFRHSHTDYKSWARGLKGAGYATAPHYADMLIKIIEDEKLFLLDYEGGSVMYSRRDKYSIESFDGTPASIANRETTQETVAESGEGVIDPDNYRVTINAHKGYNVYSVNNTNYIEAKGGESLKSIAKKFDIWQFNLSRFNDIKRGETLVSGEKVYLESRRRIWGGEKRTHTAKKGETLQSISTLYGVRVSSLKRFNHIGDTYQSLEEGKEIKLRRRKRVNNQ